MKNDVYEKTTHSLEALDTAHTTSVWPLRCLSGSSRVSQDEYELERLNAPKDARVSQTEHQVEPSTSADCSVEIRTGSSADNEEDGQPIPEKAPLKERMMTFFGLYDESQEEWEKTRRRHVKRIGKSKKKEEKEQSDQPIAATTKEVAAATPEERVQLSSGSDQDVDVVDHALPHAVVSLFGFEEKSPEDAEQSIYYRRALRDSAAKVLWKAASRRLSAKPVNNDAPTVFSYHGRSFTPVDQENVKDKPRNMLQNMLLKRIPRGSSLLKAFGSETYQIDKLSEMIYISHGSLDLDEVDKGLAKPKLDETSDLDEVDNACSRHRNQSFCEALTPPPTPPKLPPFRTNSQVHHLGRGPIKNPHEKRKKKKLFDVVFGDSFIGNYLKGKSRSKEEIFDFRPYFTYWMSFVQVVIMFVMVSTHSFAPVGFSQKTKEDTVLISRDGALQIEQLPHTTVQSFWIGPSLNTLILLGAKYAPCMRHDTKLFKVLDEERLRENNTGCCLQTFNTGCIQRQQTECTTSFTVFKANTVCGQDPMACLDPKSIPPNEWDKNTIINWPVCYKNRNKRELLDLPHMQCEVTGRPCCIGTQAQCIITSQDYCNFKDGVYHKDKTLCSQVDCLESTCGLIPFAKRDQPNQFYRLYLSLFLNAGVLHVVIVLIFNFFILKDIEKMVGWLRTALIYMFSGIGGNLWSAVLIPYEPEVGPSGATFGILACLFVELFRYRSEFKTPYIYILKLFCFVLILFLFGLLPYIDNYAHIFGFIYGFFLGLIFLPYPNDKKEENPAVEKGNPVEERRNQEEESGSPKRKINLARLRDIVISLLFLIGLTVLGFVLFYVVQDADTKGVEYVNCIEFTENFCNNFHQGRQLEKRETTY